MLVLCNKFSLGYEQYRVILIQLTWSAVPFPLGHDK